MGGGEDRGQERDAHRGHTEGQRETFDLLPYVEPHESLHPCRIEIKLLGEKRCDGHHANGDWTRWGLSTHHELNPTMVAVFVNGTVL